jgi:hypothetical protein
MKILILFFLFLVGCQTKQYQWSITDSRGVTFTCDRRPRLMKGVAYVSINGEQMIFGGCYTISSKPIN